MENHEYKTLWEKKVKLFSRVQLFATPWTVAHQSPPSMGFPGWGIHVKPWLIHVNVWQKPLQYCKVISLQLIKINKKKKKERVLEWIAISFSRGPSWPRDWTQVSYIVGRCFTVWATRGLPTKHCRYAQFIHLTHLSHCATFRQSLISKDDTL